MGRTLKPRRQGKSRKQLDTLAKARAAKLGQDTDQHCQPTRKRAANHSKHEEVQQSVHLLKKQVEVYKTKYYNERRKNKRLGRTVEELKGDVKGMTEQVRTMRATLDRLGREAARTKEELEYEVKGLREKISKLEEGRKELVRDRTVLRKRTQRLLQAKRKLKEKLQHLKRTRPRTFRMMKSGIYTRQARALARFLVATGMAEDKVGVALKQVAGVLGMDVDRVMTARTVQRCVLEGGVASDIQLTFEMAKASSEF